MKHRFGLGLVASLALLGAGVSEAREIKDPEAKFKIKIPEDWTATTQSSRDGSSIFWAFSSPKGNFRVVVRADKAKDRRACKDLLDGYKKQELKARIGDGYKDVPLPPEEAKGMNENSCGGVYIGARPNKAGLVKPYIVFLHIERKGGRLYHWLGEAEYENFETRAKSFEDAVDSIQVDG